MHRCARKCLNQRRCANTAPANDPFARTVTTDSRINIGVGVTAAQKWDVSVFVLSTERPCDWGDLAGVGVTAAPYPVASLRFRAMFCCHSMFDRTTEQKQTRKDTLASPRRGKQLGKAPPPNWRRRGVPTLAHPRKVKERRRRPPWTVGGIEAE